MEKKKKLKQTIIIISVSLFIIIGIIILLGLQKTSCRSIEYSGEPCSNYALGD
jgi:hypothetical protein